MSELHTHCQCDYCDGEDCKDMPAPTKLCVATTDELVEELSKRVGVRRHTSVDGTYLRVFVGENDSGKILTWQTEHGKATVLVVKKP